MSTRPVRASNTKASMAQVMLETLESRTLLSAACPHFSFVLAAVANVPAIQAAVSSITLVNTINGASLPSSIIPGKAPKSANIKVKIVNAGSVATLKAGKVNVVVALRPAAGGADVIIGSKIGQNFGNVKPVTGSQTASVSVKVPLTLAAGTYTLVATVTPLNFIPDANNVATGPTITLAAAPSTNVLGNIGNVITLASLIDTQTTVLPGGFGSTTVQHWNFTDNKNQSGELFITQNTGTIAGAADATINFFPNGAIGSGSVVLKGKDASRALAVGTQFNFGKTGTISCTVDSYTHGTCKVSRIN